MQNFEVIVVNDGSKDRTGEIVARLAAYDRRIRLINHPVNKGYGAALVTGFESATKELTFFMDSDGQFDIHDLVRFFPLIEEYGAVLGYRIDRQDTWMRKLNALGWKKLVSFIFGVQVRDIDCAFKLFRTEFFHTHRLETRGAMINAEILYKLARAGYSYTELGVQHLPRRAGKATGAKLTVILRALCELFMYAEKWRKEEQQTLYHHTNQA
jgi:glycosyltransferase involved in cell wall biosynthesis